MSLVRRGEERDELEDATSGRMESWRVARSTSSSRILTSAGPETLARTAVSPGGWVSMSWEEAVERFDWVRLTECELS